MRKRHIKSQNEIILTEDNKSVILSLEKSLHLFSNDIIFNIGFTYRPKGIPENILYTVIYKEKETGIELEQHNIIENIHSDIYKPDFWKMPLKKQIGGLIANRIIITVEPFIFCDFWLNVKEIKPKF